MEKDYVYHLAIHKKDMKGADTALLPGDPDRVEKIASCLQGSKQIASKREFKSYLGETDGIPILVTSTGVGAPSTSVCVEELAQLGIRTFIRVGTTGSIQEHVKIGDKVIANAAVRLEGASKSIAPIEYPAVANFDVTNAIVASAKKEGAKFHIGIAASTDTFYQGQERYDTYSGYVPTHLRGSLKEWQQLGILNYEMEAALLFTMCSTMGLRSGAICGVIAERTRSETVIDPATLDRVEKEVSLIAVNAAKLLKA